MKTDKKSLPTVKTIHQVLPQFSARDAIGNEARLIQKSLQEMGIDGEIYYDERSESGLGIPFDHFKGAQSSATTLLYHFSVGSAIPFRLMELGVRIWTRYHNITPGYFFNKPKELGARMACNLGRRQLPMIGLVSEAILADSRYNLSELTPYSKAPSTVIPVFRDYGVLGRIGATAKPVFKKDASQKTILFVGRICPNKAQHDLVELVALAKKFGPTGLRLVLVGGFYSDDFRDAVVALAKDLGVSISLGARADWSADVVVPGSVSDKDMAACYRDADAFVCLSDHEGFGVPLVEAMTFGLPILAHASSAVTETVGSAGLIVDKSDKVSLLKSLNEILFDDSLRSLLKLKGAQRAEDLGLATSKNQLKKFIQDVTSSQIS